MSDISKLFQEIDKLAKEVDEHYKENPLKFFLNKDGEWQYLDENRYKIEYL